MVLELSFLKSTQTRMLWSFFLTNTTGEAYGLLLFRITPFSNIFRMAWRNSSIYPGGTLRWGCLNGTSSLRWISCSTAEVHPRSRSLFAKACDRRCSRSLAFFHCSSVRGASWRLTCRTEFDGCGFTGTGRSHSTTWAVAKDILLGSLTALSETFLISTGTRHVALPGERETNPGATDSWE